MALTEVELKSCLSSVKAPGSRLNIWDSQQIKKWEAKEKSYFFQLSLSEVTPVVEKSLKFQIESVIQKADPDAQIVVEFTSTSAAASNKPQVGTMIAIASGKGGVGKSSMTVNLASALQRLGYKVGILDCDIYGPSIPTLLGLEGQKPMMMDGKIQPLEAHGFKVMSTGFFVEEGQSLIWRGPMIHKLIQQFVHDVNWSGLDILLVDLPPGTGDAPLSLSQTMPLTGAVMVSIPPKLSIIDVHKGISMFNQVKVPILGVIENMSHYVCSHCHHEDAIFDRGSVKKFCAEVGVAYLGDVPLDPRLRELSDSGKPFFAEHEDSPAGQAILKVAERLTPFIKSLEDTQENTLRIIG